MKYGGAFTALLLLVLLLSACSKDHAQQSNCQTCPTISFSADIIPIFRQNCTAGCHTGSNPSGHVNLDSSVAYAQVLAPGKGYVNPGVPVTSILIDQLYVGAPNHMPVTGQLDDCTIQKIYCWINQGAVNN